MPPSFARDFPPYAQRRHEAFREIAEYSTKGHGRRARYRLQVTSRLNAFLKWPGLQRVCRLTREVIRDGKRTKETAYAITSCSNADATSDELLQCWIRHWHIENRLHWVRDTAFGEDADRIRNPRAGHVLAALRNAAINVLRLAQTTNITAALRENAYRVDCLLARLGIFKE